MRTITNRITVRQMLRLAACTFIGLSMAACAGDDAAQGEQQSSNEDKNPAGTTIFSSVDQSDESAPSTRTAIVDHVKGGGAKVNWSATDKIWVKDNAGTWQQSAAATIPAPAKKSVARFALNGTYSNTTHDVVYTNLSISGNQPQVEIKATQAQTAPNNFDHAGESGDCGIATATENGGLYQFILNHKASYLCLIPRSSNEYVHRSKLMKIEITAEDNSNIAGTYDIASDGTLTLASGGSKTITLTTGSGFDLDNVADDMDKNAAYAVIAPGTHSLRIRYWLKNPTDNFDYYGNPAPIEGTITKYVTMNFEAGKIHDITANLTLRNYPGNNYYMWDARKPYWYGHEWDKAGYVLGVDQSTDFRAASAYPKPGDADRYSNTILGYGGGNGTHGLFNPSSAQHVPNVNEMTWYAMKGDLHNDANELWTTMGHLCKGGMWLKKAAKIAADNGISTEMMKSVAYDKTTDMRITYKTSAFASNYSISQAPLTKSQQADYFYLPALRYYHSGMLFQYSYVMCWSSNISPINLDQAYAIGTAATLVQVITMPRSLGIIAVPFE